MTRSRTKNDLTTGRHSLRRSRTISSPVQQDQAPRSSRFRRSPTGGGCTLVLTTSTVSWKAWEYSNSSIYGDRAHLLCPGREGTFKDRWSTGVYGNRSLKRRDTFGNGGVHPEFNRRKTLETTVDICPAPTLAKRCAGRGRGNARRRRAEEGIHAVTGP